MQKDWKEKNHVHVEFRIHCAVRRRDNMGKLVGLVEHKHPAPPHREEEVLLVGELGDEMFM